MCLIGTENICVTGGIARIFKKRGAGGRREVIQEKRKTGK